MRACLKMHCVFSEDRMYRYLLWRQWGEEATNYLLVIGLNPSTADETRDDPTIRRCIGFAQRWGLSALCMANLFAYRSPVPAPLYTVEDPVGADNDTHIAAVAAGAAIVLAAWGTHGTHKSRGDVVREYLQVRPLVCLGMNRNGTPKHPLYIPKDCAPKPY
jgi:hypothetical protein